VFDSLPRQEIFSITRRGFYYMSRVFCSEVKQAVCEVAHSSVCTADKNAWSYTSTPLHAFMVWCLIEHMDDFIVSLFFHLYV
jgi:hypothetical protein